MSYSLPFDLMDIILVTGLLSLRRIKYGVVRGVGGRGQCVPEPRSSVGIKKGERITDSKLLRILKTRQCSM